MNSRCGEKVDAVARIDRRRRPPVGQMVAGRPASLALALLVLLAGAATPSAVAQEVPGVGDEAPGFALRSLDGVEHRLGDLRGRRNAVVIFFRGAW